MTFVPSGWPIGTPIARPWVAMNSHVVTFRAGTPRSSMPGPESIVSMSYTNSPMFPKYSISFSNRSTERTTLDEITLCLPDDGANCASANA